MISLVDAASEIVMPAIRTVFDDGEVSVIHLSMDEERGVTLELTALGETFHDWVVQVGVPGQSPSDWQERLRSNLVDFVAESPLGWGQNREDRRA